MLSHMNIKLLGCLRVSGWCRLERNGGKTDLNSEAVKLPAKMKKSPSMFISFLSEALIISSLAPASLVASRKSDARNQKVIHHRAIKKLLLKLFHKVLIDLCSHSDGLVKASFLAQPRMTLYGSDPEKMFIPRSGENICEHQNVRRLAKCFYVENWKYIS